jgi:AraC-like DNA-binding protein
MQIIFEEKKTQGTFIFHHENEKLRGKGILSESAVNTIVFNWKEDQTVYIDDCPYLFPRNSILTLVSNQNFKFVRSQDFIAVQFNREFYCLLDHDYKTQHGVQFYADLLNKSPKTLSNLFSLHKYPPPSKIIQERIVLETKRYLLYTDKTVKEISYLLGFVNPAHFSRFLKKCTGHNAAFFRKISSKD